MDLEPDQRIKSQNIIFIRYLCLRILRKQSSSYRVWTDADESFQIIKRKLKSSIFISFREGLREEYYCGYGVGESGNQVRYYKVIQAVPIPIRSIFYISIRRQRGGTGEFRFLLRLIPA